MIDFIGRRNIWLVFSGTVIAIGIIALIVNGLTFGIEFKGGTMFEVTADKPIELSEARAALHRVKLGESVIQAVGDRKTLLVRASQLSPATQDKVKAELTRAGATDFRVQSVGPTWGKQLTRGTVVALILSLVIVLAFIAIRFELKMGGAAVVALVHDILVAVGLYALVSREVTTSTVAAFLTILGYSLYDTIVIFDRIRENSAGLKRQSYSDMVNLSVNQSLRRSINTSLTSIIPVASLLFLGGETLKDFAFALLVGLASGAYSSIFIASPILAVWKESEPRYQALRKKLAKAS